MPRLRLPTRDAYEDALFIAAVALAAVCVLFMVVALVFGSWAAALWSIITLVGSMVIVFIIAFFIENRTRHKGA